MSDNTDGTLDAVTRRRVLAGAGTAGALGLAGCTGGSDDGAAGSDTSDTTETTGTGGDGTSTATAGGGTLNFAQSKSPLDFDPLKANDVPSLQVVERLFDSLYTYGEGTELVPKLAAAEPEVNEDATEYVVELRDGVTFHNDEPITAEDVKYSFLAPGREETANGSEFTMIDSITVVDERTVRFDLSYPFGPFRHKLAWSPVPKAYREENKQSFNRDPVGSGPFTLESATEGDEVVMERWDEYHGSAPSVEEVVFGVVEEPTTRVTTLKNGEFDIVQTVPPKLYSTVKNQAGSSVAERQGLGYYYLSFNCNEGPTADPKVREAIDYAVSMDDAVANYIDPAGTRLTAPMPETVTDAWDFPTDEWADIPHDKDTDMAAQLLEEAGVSKDYSWKIIVPPDDKREQIGISVGNGLQEAGFSNVEIQRLDWGAFLDQYSTGNEDDYNMYTLGWVDEFDPDGYLYYMFHPDVEGETNGCYYRNEAVADKLTQARQSADREERNRLYTEATTTILEDRAHLPAYNLKNSFGVRDAVEGFRPHTVSGINPRLAGEETVSLND
ncbi:ABC transporter substrate-binding protein [Halobaculum magnesiiphilum]|uniref:ABC transporter substrate-binding protein n=1 Tax=Halobaculum magnesiiphilum TaxID=1017351 RepID=A0A8T8WG78_9EURY|nr:ABC transporter substrate-binding protein [Halobaculum magnesiiphilum]QZP38855.1 ABC transporter substrate-binding protein [Halobaculum magnesiiphilum]